MCGKARAENLNVLHSIELYCSWISLTSDRTGAREARYCRSQASRPVTVPDEVTKRRDLRSIRGGAGPRNLKAVRSSSLKEMTTKERRTKRDDEDAHVGWTPCWHSTISHFLASVDKYDDVKFQSGGHWERTLLSMGNLASIYCLTWWSWKRERSCWERGPGVQNDRVLCHMLLLVGVYEETAIFILDA